MSQTPPLEDNPRLRRERTHSAEATLRLNSSSDKRAKVDEDTTPRHATTDGGGPATPVTFGVVLKVAEAPRQAVVAGADPSSQASNPSPSLFPYERNLKLPNVPRSTSPAATESLGDKLRESASRRQATEAKEKARKEEEVRKAKEEEELRRKEEERRRKEEEERRAAEEEAEVRRIKNANLIRKRASDPAWQAIYCLLDPATRLLLLEEGGESSRTGFGFWKEPRKESSKFEAEVLKATANPEGLEVGEAARLLEKSLQVIRGVESRALFSSSFAAETFNYRLTAALSMHFNLMDDDTATTFSQLKESEEMEFRLKAIREAVLTPEGKRRMVEVPAEIRTRFNYAARGRSGLIPQDQGIGITEFLEFVEVDGKPTDKRAVLWV